MDSDVSFEEILNQLLEEAKPKLETNRTSHSQATQSARTQQFELQFERWHRVAQRPVFPRAKTSKPYESAPPSEGKPLSPELSPLLKSAILYFRKMGFPSVHERTPPSLLKRCFRTLAKRLHPDFHPEKGEAPFRELQMHYEILVEYLEQPY